MAKQVISLIGGEKGAPFLSERLATAAGILPGHLVEEALGKVKVHATAAVNAQPLFAQTDLGVAGDIDEAYVINASVSYGAYQTGQEVNALLAAAATAVIDGAAMESAGDGTIRTATADAATDTVQRDSIVGYAIEAVDNSGGGAVARIKIRVA
jgi:hypothetical protein